jgi:L-2-hydroxyglutarate oxidase
VNYKADIVVIGAGIIGAAAAWQLIQQYPSKKVLLLEKEPQVASHQTGRNSGVIHAGVYYPADSLKAKYCKQGLEATIQFCQKYNLPYSQCGKLLVATNPQEVQRMHALYERCQDNQLEPILLSQQQLKDIEPNVRGEEAFLIKKTGITSYTTITDTLVKLFVDAGGEVYFEQQVVAISESESGVSVSTTKDNIQCLFLVNCAGLQADRIAKMLDVDIDYQIIPFKGEYFRLPAKYNNLVKHLIYPIPDPNLPFLGVHLTRMIDGSITVGPNAVLAFAREGYNKWQFSFEDNLELLKFAGTWPLMKQHFGSGLTEFKNSVYKKGYLALVQKYCPKITLEDLQPYPSGIRAQAVDKSGALIHDFKFTETERSLHIGNAPSPAATSAFPIASSIVQRLIDKWDY